MFFICSFTGQNCLFCPQNNSIICFQYEQFLCNVKVMQYKKCRILTVCVYIYYKGQIHTNTGNYIALIDIKKNITRQIMLSINYYHQFFYFRRSSITNKVMHIYMKLRNSFKNSKDWEYYSWPSKRSSFVLY